MARFQCSSLFSDHAVLARRKEIRIFGEADVAVTAELRDDAGRLLASDTAPSRDGRFLCLMPPQEAATGCTLTVRCGNEEAIFTDIAVGEVYLAGGQSNMELALINADEGAACVAAHDNPLVRYYNVPQRARWNEEAAEANRTARWTPVAPGTAGDMSAVAYFFAMKLQKELGVPVGIVDCYWGGTSVTCWMDEETLDSLAEGRRYVAAYAELSKGVTMAAYLEKEKAFLEGLDRWNRQVEALKKDNPAITWDEVIAQAGYCPWNPPAGPGSPYRPGGLYKTMLERVIPLTLTGVLFYQGEEDAARTDRYDELLFALIRLLRARFMDDMLPFLNVQLPMWIDAGVQDTFTWPRLRLAQQRVCDMDRHSGLVCLLDQGEFNNIHPTAKRVVGERLMQEALRVVHGKAVPQAPRAIQKYRDGNRLHVRLTQAVTAKAEGNLMLEIAGADGAFYPADAAIEGEELILSSPCVARPVAVRYAYTDYAKVLLFGENGLPLSPFWLQ